MYARSVAFALLALPFLASAGVSDSCNSGALQCCNSVQSAKNAEVVGLLSTVGVVASQVTGLVGVTCSPITGVGVSGTSCSKQTVCCENNTFKGVVAIGCTPINVTA